MPFSPYLWADDWFEGPNPSSAMSHTGVVVTRSGLVVHGATDAPALVVRGADGALLALRPVAGATELHDLTLVEEDGEELIWVADSGVKLRGGGNELDRRRGAAGGQVFQIDLEGRLRRRLERPPVELYASHEFLPTAVAVWETRLGGNGDIWVADGYGASLVHRLSASGDYLQTIDGTDGAGRFNQPHDVMIDWRRSPAELYVSDRVNQRIQVFSLEGAFLRVVGAGALPGPTQMTLCGDTLAVTDLLAGRVTLFDSSDALIAHLFPHPSPPAGWTALPDGWPNRRQADGTLAAVLLERGSFHTPHGIAAGADGRLYVAEFAIGGRVAVLDPVLRD